MTRLATSDPAYPAIEMALRDGEIALNPWCWFGVDTAFSPERALAIIDAENALDDLLEDARLAVFAEYVNGA